MDGVLAPTEVALRPPEQVMRLSRMGSFHPMRLSFMRILLRRVKAEGWQISRPVWDLDDAGVGRAVYTARGPHRTYSLIVYSHDLPDHLRSDRVIAEAWDATFALHDGEPTAEDLDRLQGHVPVQEAGRMSMRELTLSRANRSVRLFSHVIDALADGRQPDPEELSKVGYLMRTTAVYGSGKFGLSDREVYCDRPEMTAPFQAEMLTVWLIRTFSVDIVEHLARVKGGDRAVRLDPDLRRGLGIGNSTGLGMAPFLLTHPVLINNWITARETALARVRSLASFSATAWQTFRTALSAAIANLDRWRTDHPIQIAKLDALRQDLSALDTHVRAMPDTADHPADALWRWGEASLSEEGQEQLLSLLMEPFGEIVDDLSDALSADEAAAFVIDTDLTVAQLRTRIDQLYDWAKTRDWSMADETARLWYVSEEKLEPRLAERAEEPLEDYEQPLAPARVVAALRDALDLAGNDTPLATFLEAHPRHRDAVRRVQIASTFPFAEIRDNTIASDMLPIDLLRAKLSFFGATRFDPRSDRWVRITMFNDAPFPDEIAGMDADAWMYGSPEMTGAPALAEPREHQPSDEPTVAGGWSINELAALSVKAARGAGLPWGVAAEAGHTVRTLARLGLPAADALARDLSHETPGRTILLGCQIADAGTPDLAQATEHSVVPLLLLPFLQRCLSDAQGISVRTADGRTCFNVWRSGFAVGEAPATVLQAVQFHPCEAGPPAELRHRVDAVSPATLSQLTDLAHRTYAPATDQSRMQGAGAGVTDND